MRDGDWLEILIINLLSASLSLGVRREDSDEIVGVVAAGEKTRC
jgi:hypothetical protein